VQTMMKSLSADEQRNFISNGHLKHKGNLTLVDNAMKVRRRP
jgi:hypothetical protein